MLGDDVQIISVDDHVIEHPRVWTDRVAAKFKDDAPRIERAEDGNDWWIYEGQKAGNFALNAVAGKPPEDFGMDPRSYDDMLPGCYDISDRIKDMNTEGVHAQLCFPNFGGFAGSTFQKSKDFALANECTRAYNDFILDEWCAFDPGRQIPLAALPYWDVDETVKEMKRTADKGVKSWTFPELPDRIGLPSFHTDHWNPVFEFAQEANIPLSLHFGSGGSPQVSPEGMSTNMTVGITLFALNSASAMTELLLSPVFHNYPTLRMALSEGGIGWMPYVLERSDYVWERHRFYNDVHQSVRPSELFARGHIGGCFISDEAGLEMRHRIGVDHIMFESDYPHSDSQWPHTRKVLTESMVNIPDGEARKMCEDNARIFYDFPRS
ncbi:amidohydrolase family protein [Rhodococcus cercidiphylli]|uniref:Amidohydrolase family protein n=1 Tax=Rhodococcus cercidiphylli TaxID=489916 RepID=A0ABU4AWH1_9NOCA|nr:amidohydrolase family protein [Rhodococcus cercidiphylli]MDV6230581.1 amidohydrolase family protein [Rhodococcus cercidiphylli]